MNEAELSRKLALKTLCKLFGEAFIHDQSYRQKILSEHLSSPLNSKQSTLNNLQLTTPYAHSKSFIANLLYGHALRLLNSISLRCLDPQHTELYKIISSSSSSIGPIKKTIDEGNATEKA